MAISIDIPFLKISDRFNLSNIKFEIPDKKVTALVGNNGTGKTTLLNCLVKNQKIKKNQILIDGNDITKISYKMLAKQIAFIPQINDIFKDISAYDYLSMGRLPHTNFLGILNKNDRKIINDVITELKIEKIVTQPIGKLSGGERQKIIIGNALVQQTPIIVLDEPLSYLDLKSKEEIIGLISQFSKIHQKTIVIVIHELELAANIADQIVVFYDGKTSLIGEPKNVITSTNIKKYFGVEKQVKFENNKFYIL
ncbi:ABC transporter ATP-binding protein [[Mycoplasma] testudinis]|uniref:ABC transporter ATP-binding protein n=1 Tax=[Mycoplasma] testudinis TaxID=33924 RepID=UPI0004876AED|nr:ABC transporter ATP-binding protein [[Mycoplasma] testudinis]